MLNQIIIVGKIAKDIEIIETESEKKKSIITLAVTRPYKDENGEYKADLIEAVLWNGIAEQTIEYCKKGDTIGIRGRVENLDNKMIIVAEKITFLSAKKSDEQ